MYKGFSIVEGRYIAQAELSEIDYSELLDSLRDMGCEYIIPEGEWYFFNRLIVPVPLRGQGYANKLMGQVVEWAEEEKINIINPINPYGDMDLEQLTRFYAKFGFKELENGVMIRVSELIY